MSDLSLTALALLACAQNPGISLENRTTAYNAVISTLELSAHYNGSEEPNGREAPKAAEVIKHIKTEVVGPAQIVDRGAEELLSDLKTYLQEYRDRERVAAN